MAAGALVLVAATAAAPVRAEAVWPAATRESRPWTRWWWLGSAVDEANLTRQLEQLAVAGSGGVEICPIYGAKGWEDRYVPFLSPRWMELLAHTTREAQRLGLGVDLTTGTGWPFGGPWVGDVDASSSLVLKRDGQGATTGVAQDPIQKVKRAAPGGEGNVLDPYSVPALERYLARFDAAFAGFHGVPPRAHFHDSFEYYGASFTPSLWTEFEARRGYDLRTELPALAGKARRTGSRGCGATTARRSPTFTSSTSAAGPAGPTPGVASRATRRTAGPATSSTSTPPRTSRRRRCSVSRTRPRCRGSSSPRRRPTSPGGRLASAEAFTWLGEHFQTSLAQAKEAADWLLLSGVNHLVYHGVPYSPAGCRGRAGSSTPR